MLALVFKSHLILGDRAGVVVGLITLTKNLIRVFGHQFNRLLCESFREDADDFVSARAGRGIRAGGGYGSVAARIVLEYGGCILLVRSDFCEQYQFSSHSLARTAVSSAWRFSTTAGVHIGSLITPVVSANPVTPAAGLKYFCFFVAKS